MNKLRLGAIALASLALAACTDYSSYGGEYGSGYGGHGGGQKQGVGTLLGAVTGAVVGAQFGKGNGQLAATAAGTLIGALVGLLAILLLARRQNQAPAIDLTILMVVSYSLGARVLYAIVGGEWTFFTEFSLEKLQSGLWGGQVVFALFAGVYLAVSRASVRHLSDALAVTWAGGTVVHKTGCFLAGCCYGAPTAVP